MKSIIDFISTYIPITGNSFVDTVLYAIIILVSSDLAYGWTGRIFDKVGYYDSKVMSDTNHMINLAMFIFLTIIMIIIAKIIHFILNIPWWVYLIIIISIIAIFIIIAIISRKKGRKKEILEKEDITEETIKIEDKPVIVINSNRCPWCGGKLVKREGPYGYFYGCINYGKTGCRYTKR